MNSLSVKPQTSYTNHLVPAGIISLAMILSFSIYGIIQNNAQQEIGAKEIHTDTYQIVTLNNGHSYFGQLSDVNAEYTLLRNAFYLQAKDSVEAQEENTIEEPSDDELPFSLKRAGNQVYQATDDLYIRSENIISWQNLELDSPVKTAIDDYLDAKESSSDEEKREK